MAKYFAAHFCNIDNLSWLKSKGFNEAGYVIYYGSSIPSPSAIKNAGMVATLNIFNDAGRGPGTPGGPYAGYAQSIKNAGWNMIAGEGTSGEIITVVQNYLPYCNYGGIVSEQQYNMYASPWNHPKGGTHVDYIETYNNIRGIVADSCVASMQAARAAGSKHVGILIGNWMLGIPASTYINILDRGGGDTICFWGGYGPPCANSSQIQGLADQLISHYGTAKWGTPATSGGGGGGGAAAAPAPPPVNRQRDCPKGQVHWDLHGVWSDPDKNGNWTKYTPYKEYCQPPDNVKLASICPCKHLWLGIKDVNDYSTSEHLEFMVELVGQAGYMDDDQKWIPNKPYAGKLEAWCRDVSKRTWKLFDFYPDTDGTFAYWVGSDKVETRWYSVRFAETKAGDAKSVDQLLGGDTRMTIAADKTAVNVGEAFTLTGILKTTLGEPLSGQTIIFYHKVNGTGDIIYDTGGSVTTDINGSETFTTIQTIPATYNYYVKFTGDPLYQTSTSKNVNIVIADQRPSTTMGLTVTDSTPTIGQVVVFTATLTSGGSPVSNRTISIWHNSPGGQKYVDKMGTTDANGVMTLSTSWSSAGTRPYYAEYAGGIDYKSSISPVLNIVVS